MLCSLGEGSSELGLLISRIVDALKTVSGLEAVVLGGSRARGTAISSSDVDIGIYYDSESHLDLKKLARIVRELDDEKKAEFNPPGAWGPWINGGAFLMVNGIAVDFLLRDLKKVEHTILNCLSGVITIDYQIGHPHGFVSAIYLSEIFYCRLLFDLHNKVDTLKTLTRTYSEPMKRAIIERFLWEARFSLRVAEKGIKRSDQIYVIGMFYRTIACVVQVIYALNGVYFINEKGSIESACSCAKKPSTLLSCLNMLSASNDGDGLMRKYTALSRLVDELECMNDMQS